MTWDERARPKYLVMELLASETLSPTSGGEPRTVPDTKDVEVIRWSSDGRFLFGAWGA
jgi:DNA polymerase II small subunit/DNA polymerase delta subunit B